MKIDMEKQMVKSQIISGGNFIANMQQKSQDETAEKQVASKVQKALDGAAVFEISEEGKQKLKDQQRLMDASSDKKEETKQIQEDFNPVAVSPDAAKSYQEKIRELRAAIDTKNEIRETGEQKLKEYEAQSELYGEEDRAIIDAAREELYALTDTRAEKAGINGAYSGKNVVFGAHSPEVLLKEAMKGESILEPSEQQPDAEKEQIQASNETLMETYVNKSYEGDSIEEQVAPSEDADGEKEAAAEKQPEEERAEGEEIAAGEDTFRQLGVTLQDLEEAREKQ